MNGLLEPILKELRITLQAHLGNEHSRLTHCWVCGGGAKLQEVGGYVSRQLGLYPVGPRQGFGADPPRAFSIAFGLAIHPKIIRPRWRFNSTPMELALDLKGVTDAASPDSATTKQDRRLAIAAGLVIAFLAIVDFSIHFMLHDRGSLGLKRRCTASTSNSLDRVPLQEKSSIKPSTASESWTKHSVSSIPRRAKYCTPSRRS